MSSTQNMYAKYYDTSNSYYCFLYSGHSIHYKDIGYRNPILVKMENRSEMHIDNYSTK